MGKIFSLFSPSFPFFRHSFIREGRGAIPAFALPPDSVALWADYTGTFMHTRSLGKVYCSSLGRRSPQPWEVD